MSRYFHSRGDKRSRNRLIVFAYRAIALVVLCLYFGIPLFDVYRAMHPHRFPVGVVTPADLSPEYSEATLTTKDNLTLHGWYVPSENRAAVILVHAFQGNRTGTIYHAELLAQHGYGVLMYDTRTQGESEGDLYALGWEDHLDVLAALEFLQARPEVDPGRIGVLGLSAGAKAALYSASQTEGIAAVVAEGTRWRTFEDQLLATEPKWYVWIPSEWMAYQFAELACGIRNPTPLHLAVAGISSTPILLITAEAELITSRAYFDEISAEKTIWVRDEPGHQVDALFDEPLEYERRVLGFLDRALLRDD